MSLIPRSNQDKITEKTALSISSYQIWGRPMTNSIKALVAVKILKIKCASFDSCFGDYFLPYWHNVLLMLDIEGQYNQHPVSVWGLL